MSRFIYLHRNICLSHTQSPGHLEILSNKLHICVCIFPVHLFMHTFICFVFRSYYFGASDPSAQKIHISSSVILRQAKTPTSNTIKAKSKRNISKGGGESPAISLTMCSTRYFFPSPPFPFPSRNRGKNKHSPPHTGISGTPLPRRRRRGRRLKKHEK